MNSVQLAHGSGGQAMQQLINSLFMEAFANPWLAEQEDQARLDWHNWLQKAIVWRFQPTAMLSIRCSSRVAISASWPSAVRLTTWRSAARSSLPLLRFYPRRGFADGDVENRRQQYGGDRA